jgi:hypothetical protein
MRSASPETTLVAARQEHDLFESRTRKVVQAQVEPSRCDQDVAVVELGHAIESFLGLVRAFVGGHHRDLLEIVFDAVRSQETDLAASDLGNASCEDDFLARRQCNGLRVAVAAFLTYATVQRDVFRAGDGSA